MPIYEFYCAACNRIFSFFSRRIDTESRPVCPSCKKRKLSREVSAFASIGRHKGDDTPGGDGDTALDEPRVERAMESLAQEAAGLDDSDPRQAANLMRKFSEATGMKMGEGMEEAMRRLEAGEDPESVEAEMGDRLEKEDPLTPGGAKKRGGRKAAPSRDKTLYEL
jgi:putative FmdB family regulatory protein